MLYFLLKNHSSNTIIMPTKSARQVKSTTKPKMATTTILSPAMPSPTLDSSPSFQPPHRPTSLSSVKSSLDSLQAEIEAKATTTTNGKAEIRQDKINEALWAIDEIMERCTLPYVVLGEAAYCIKHELPFKENKIVFGLLKQHAVPSQTSLLPTLAKDINVTSFEYLTDGYRIFIGEVAIIIRIIPKKYPTLLDPDTVTYNNWWYKLPNPFNEYWEHTEHYDR